MRRPLIRPQKLQTGIPAVKVPPLWLHPGSILAAFSASDRSKLTRLLVALALVCVVGAGFAATILYVHGQIDAHGESYTSFCTVNSTINCDRVLTSPYAKLGGISVAWLALASYLGLAALFALAARTGRDDSRVRLLGLGTVGVIGALVFSAYMAVTAAIRIEALCLLCTGLYAVALVNAGLAAAAFRSVRHAGGPSPLPPMLAAATFLVSALGVTALGFLTWTNSTEAPISASIVTADDVKKADPEFYAWFTSQPKVGLSTLVRSEQVASLPHDKVVLVDFFDLECAHCKKNYLLIKDLVARRGQQIAIVHRHFPLDATCNDVVEVSVHPNACRAAEAVECAGLQGKHEEMIDILFANQGQLFAENLIRLGGKIGLDKDALQRCLDEHRTLPSVLADARAGAALDIQSTPTVFLGGRRIQGVLDSIGKYEMAVLIETPHGP